MKRNFLVYLDDILESVDRIEEYAKGKTQEDFDSDIAFQDAVLRRLEIIGEAVRHIPVLNLGKGFCNPASKMGKLAQL